MPRTYQSGEPGWDKLKERAGEDDYPPSRTTTATSGDEEAAGCELTTPSLLQAALGYADRGWPVLPLYGVRDEGCSCGATDCTAAGKHPAIASGTDHTAASTDHEVIAGWFRNQPDRNVGLVTGARSDLIVIDVDVPGPNGGANGLATLAELDQRHGALPKTRTHLSGGGGHHLLFRHPGGGRIPSRAGSLGPGVDVKADGGYVVAPPSSHASGNTYKLTHDRELAKLPAAWLTLLRGRPSEPAAAAAHAATPIPEGTRNVTLTRLAGSIRRAGFSEQAIAAALLETNQERCRPPLQEPEVRLIAKSIAKKPPAEPEPPIEPVRLEAMTAREVCALPDPPDSDQLLGELVLRRQRLVLGAHTGEGKTTMALAIVQAVVGAEAFLDWSGAGDRRALVIDAEQGLRSIKRRLHESGLAESDAVDYVRVPDGLTLDRDPQHAAAVEGLLEAGEYDLVLADPLYKLHAGDSNAERDAVDLMRRLDAWREHYGFALVLPVHCRKPIPGTKFTIHDLFGSTAYVRGAEVVLGLQRVSDGYARLHFLKDRDGDLPIGAAWRLLFDRDSGFTRDPNDGEKETSQDRVRQALQDEPHLTIDELTKRTAYAERTVRGALKKLGADSDHSKPAHWWLPDPDNQ